MRVRLVNVLALAILCISWLGREGHSATVHVPAEHATIQAAIDAAVSGDTIMVAPGVYRERIRLKQGVILRSAGDDRPGTHAFKRTEVTVIDGQGAKGFGVSMAEGSTLDGFTVTNVGHYDEAVWNEHHATRGEQQDHAEIGQPGSSGISVLGVTCTIQNNVVRHNGGTGIEIRGVEGGRCSPHVYRNVCFRNMGGGIGSIQKSTAVIQENICFQNFYAGIGHHNASPSVIKNRCYENIRAGIGISEGACPIVRGNQCYQNRRAGIGIRTGAATRPVVEDNDCYENGMAGIGCADEAAPIVCSNRCYKNKLAGIGSRTRATPTIVGNECYENETVGIGQEGDAVTLLVDNYCHHNASAGVGFAECEAGRSTVVKNRIRDNARVAVGIHAGWTVHLTGNELSREGGVPPIVMVFEKADVTLTNNTISGGGIAGLRVAGKVRADGNEFVGRAGQENRAPNFAVWALPGSQVSLTNNKISGWRQALHAQNATVTEMGNVVRTRQPPFANPHPDR